MESSGQNESRYSRANPAFLYSPRCGAKTRRGTPCQSPAVQGKKRCRMHGGAPGSGAQPDNKNALKHGYFSAEAIAERAEIRSFVEETQNLLTAIAKG